MRRLHFSAWILGVAFAVAPLQEKRDLDLLLDGVHTIPLVGTPGPFAVFGEKSFAVVVGSVDARHRAAAVAAARFGSGRIVLLGHGGYADPGIFHAGDLLPFAKNCVHWLAPKSDAPRVGVQGDGWKSAMKLAGFEVRELAGDGAFDKLDDLDVVCVHPLDLSEHAVERLREFTKRGGGVFGADLGWGWQQTRPNLVLNDRPAQRWMVECGLAFTTSYLGATAKDGFAVDGAPDPVWNAWHALDRLAAADAKSRKADELGDASWSVMFAFNALPDTPTPLRNRLEKLVREHAAALVPSEAQPLRKENALERALLSVQMKLLDATPIANVKAHPAAADFPGAVEAEPVSQALDVDTSIPEWHSTGLYANPGARIVVQVPSTAKDGKLKLRIGCHTDQLWDHDAWTRVPSISREFALSQESTTVASPYGGLVYVEVPAGSALGKLHLVIRGAIAAPHYVLGATELATWKESIRKRPAPWAELESKRLVIALPSRVVRELDDPKSLMEFWDRVLDAQADLVGVPHERARPERFVCDRDISAGYMHSGYPIMMFLDVPPVLVDLARLESGTEIWGFVHELGHNLQQPDWTFEGTGEVTNNVLAVYAIESCCHLPSGKRGHEAVEHPPSIADYLKNGAKFDEWKSNPFLALEMYLELQAAFGWDAFRQVFAEYRALHDGDRPKNDDEKRDQWMVRFSRRVGRNLGPFFQAWGVPTSDQARATIAELPAWMPDDFPKR